MYIINEYQTTGGNTSVVTPVTEADWFQANSIFHQKLMYAAISSVEKHCVILTDEVGTEYDKKIYYHGDTLPVEPAA